ncbi:uncharacterized protein LOC111630315 [Centruroides sculpturatus]|uniref:uncharacterized protein LOC111630315 n=1 Tax=Centruroides sculpturatus TaxID=218467 RepID=UPI000C6DEA90|nr:uncharacterized protein LOC111630315 [Centruroides sculpturatus]
MVHLTSVNFLRVWGRIKGRSSFFKKQQIFRLSAKFYGRKRNCYSIAIKYVHKALLHSAVGRKLRIQNHIAIWKQRLEAGCQEFGYDYGTLLQGMIKSDIVLNRKMLSELAIWEPRTFKALVSIAATKKFSEDSKRGLNELKPPPDGVITRGML